MTVSNHCHFREAGSERGFPVSPGLEEAGEGKALLPGSFTLAFGGCFVCWFLPSANILNLVVHTKIFFHFLK